MKKIKYLLALTLLLAALLLVTGCSQEKTPYQINDSENYTVSIKYDANGGSFTTNTSVIVDTYSLSDLPVGANGKAQVALITPDDPARGKTNAFPAVKSGYFLTGWYATRTETGVDDAGNPVYAYADKWDFENGLLELDVNGTYSAEEPQLTLYAAWAPMLQVEFCQVGSDEVLSTYAFAPTEGTELAVPAWNTETGAIEMYKFPVLDGHTFEGAFLDKDGKQPITGSSIAHPGVVDEATGAVENGSLRLYVSYIPGNWYHIYNVDQFVKNANINNSLEIHADLDFTDKIWPSNLMTGSYTGTIHGNGHTLSNITISHRDTKRLNAGLFGRVDSGAVIEDVVFENVSFTIAKGVMNSGTSYGLLAGSVADGAQLSGVKILSGTIYIDSDCYFADVDYAIGLVCGMGEYGDIDYSGISCLPSGNAPEKVTIAIDGNAVTVDINME